MSDYFPYTEDEVRAMNEENRKHQAQLNREYKENHKPEPRPERTEYVIRCKVCGPVVMFGWAKGDPPLMADWRGVFETLKKHQRSGSYKNGKTTRVQIMSQLRRHELVFDSHPA